MNNKDKLLKLIDYWFYSDLDIEFQLSHKHTKGKKALCLFESDVYYEHINDSKRQVTVKSIRHNGKHRRLIVVECDNEDLWQYLKQYCYTLYNITELKELVNEIAYNCRIWNS